jgi:hypothetical protein
MGADLFAVPYTRPQGAETLPLQETRIPGMDT